MNLVKNLVGKVFFNLTEIQTSANTGEVVVICAQRRNLNYSGHICVVVPETENHNAEWNNGEAVKLLQSQAGSKNFRYATSDRWWASSKYRNFGFWKQYIAIQKWHLTSGSTRRSDLISKKYLTQHRLTEC